VIDAYVRIAVIGIELITIDARIVIASVDTYLRFAEAVNRLDLAQAGDNLTIKDFGEQAAEMETEGAIEGVEDKLTPDGSALGKAAKGALAAAAVGAAAAAAREIGKRSGGDDDGDGSDDG
jgi:hypothetical protein